MNLGYSHIEVGSLKKRIIVLYILNSQVPKMWETSPHKYFNRIVLDVEGTVG